MRNIKSFLILALLAVGSALFAAYYFTRQFSQSKHSSETASFEFSTPVRNGEATTTLPGFREASKKSRPSVVFIKTEASVNRRGSFWFFDFDPFGNIGKVSATGSGVILSADGYIVTNNHVIHGADKIEVVINNGKRSYLAEVVGRAPSSDLALLKIDATGLIPIELSDSEETEIGDWVLAVGNPFNLTSTVTAGIVSAKGRNINIVDNQFPIESFIQTDAAINPGNSGGALVNLEGKLVGVNTAIASKTGSYVGYGFAIPSNIVVKIVNDLKEYGQIQQAFDGLDVSDLSEELSNRAGGLNDGVYVNRVSNSHRTASKGLQAGDVIVGIDGKRISNKAEYDEQLALHRPGETLRYSLVRDGKDKDAEIRMENMDGTYDLKRKESVFSESLGAEFENISKVEKELYGIDGGIKVTTITTGKVRKMNLPEGFIFTALNNQKVSDVDSFVTQLEGLRGQVRIEGISPHGGRQFLSFYMY
ncbi:MAG: trypsin-like peptidase domain-containing protein [Bacteroidetes bacterium]|nr:trypsin-like peptidase domain-containing protein [Bacteroidota bacterium]